MITVETALNRLLTLSGIICAALVDSQTGAILGKAASKEHMAFDIDTAAKGNSRVMRAKLETIEALRLDDEIEDIFITLQKQYHVIRPIPNAKSIFLYCVLDFARSNPFIIRQLMEAVGQELGVQMINM